MLPIEDQPCPPFARITSQAECRRAIAQLGFRPDPPGPKGAPGGWLGSWPYRPKCYWSHMTKYAYFTTHHTGGTNRLNKYNSF